MSVTVAYLSPSTKLNTVTYPSHPPQTCQHTEQLSHPCKSFCSSFPSPTSKASNNSTQTTPHYQPHHATNHTTLPTTPRYQPHHTTNHTTLPTTPHYQPHHTTNHQTNLTISKTCPTSNHTTCKPTLSRTTASAASTGARDAASSARCAGRS
jgi:hypothetical protein